MMRLVKYEDAHAVVAAVCAASGLEPTELLSFSRRHREVYPRQVAMALLRDQFHWPVSDIGTFFRRDHGTVCHACKAVAAAMETADAGFVKLVTQSLRKLARVRRKSWEVAA